MNIFRQMLISIYKPKEIAFFRFQGIGKPILYIFVLMIIASIPSGYQTGLLITNTINQVQSALTEDVPPFSIEKGILVSEIPSVYKKETDHTIFMIDPNNQIAKEDFPVSKNGILLTKYSAVIFQDGLVKEYRYQNFGNITISKQEVVKIANNMEKLLSLIIMVVVVVSYLLHVGMKFIGISVLAAIAIFLRNKLGVKAPYRNLWIMAAYAVTLPTLLFAFIEIFQWNIPYSFTIYWVTAITLIYLAIGRIPRPKKSNE